MPSIIDIDCEPTVSGLTRVLGIDPNPPTRYNPVTVGGPAFATAPPDAAPKAADAPDKEGSAVYGEEISTFDVYVPHSLPYQVVDILVKRSSLSSSSGAASSTAASSSAQGT